MNDIEKEKIKTTKVIGKDASPIDHIKFNICQQIIRFKRKQDLMNKDLAEIIGVGPAVISRLLHCEIDRFKIDSLLSYFLCLITSLDNKKLANNLNVKLSSFLKEST